MPFEQSRRDALRLAGTAAGFSLAGCLSNISFNANPLSVGDSATVERGDVTVEAVRARQTLVALKNQVHPAGGVHGKPATQFAVVDVTTDGMAEFQETAEGAVAVYLDSEQYEWSPTTLIRNMNEENAASLAFSVPTDVAVTEGRIEWVEASGDTAASWTIPQEVLERLSDPPKFSVASFSVPSAAEDNSSIEATIEAQNIGGSDGVFLAEIGFTANSVSHRLFELDVPAGETVTHTERLEVHSSHGNEETLAFGWGRGSLTRTVRIEE